MYKMQPWCILNLAVRHPWSSMVRHPWSSWSWSPLTVVLSKSKLANLSVKVVRPAVSNVIFLDKLLSQIFNCTNQEKGGLGGQ